MHLTYPLVLAAALFSVGVYGVLARRGAIPVLMAVELMLGAVVLQLVAVDAALPDPLGTGQALGLFTVTLAAAEVGLGLALVLLVFRDRATSDLPALRLLADDAPPAAE